MSEAILVAIIAALGSVIGQWLITRKQNQEKTVAEVKRDERLEAKRMRLAEEYLSATQVAADAEALGAEAAVALESGAAAEAAAEEAPLA